MSTRRGPRGPIGPSGPVGSPGEASRKIFETVNVIGPVQTSQLSTVPHEGDLLIVKVTSGAFPLAILKPSNGPFPFPTNYKLAITSTDFNSGVVNFDTSSLDAHFDFSGVAPILSQSYVVVNGGTTELVILASTNNVGQTVHTVQFGTKSFVPIV
jgi:hypothetical protein